MAYRFARAEFATLSQACDEGETYTAEIRRKASSGGAPGVIDVTNNYVEHPEVVADRLERLANVVGRERVIASTDSGFAAFAGASGMTLHVKVMYGKNNHHVAEAIFKAFARALREAVALNTRISGVLSTKGSL